MHPLRTTCIFLAIPICSCAVGMIGPRQAPAQEFASASAVRHAAAESLSQLNAWLGDSTVAPSWRQFLNIEQLLTNLSADEEIDRELLVKTITRFQSGAEGLETRHFQHTAAALRQLAAQQGISENAILSSQIRREANRFQPATDERIGQAQSELRQSLEELESYLSRGSESDKNGWKEYLEWEQLQEQAESPKPDASVLGRIAVEKLRGGHPGLERPSFVRVRKAVTKLRLIALGRSSSDVIATAYTAEVANLVNLLEEAGPNPTVDTSSKIKQSVDKLETLGFPSSLAKALRKRYLFPNLRIVAGDSLIAKRFASPVTNSQRVTETILGTRFTGVSDTTGMATAGLIPSQDRARFEIVFNGETVSDTRGIRKPIRLSTRSVTQARAEMQFTLDETGFSLSVPSRANCSTNTKVRWIQAMRSGLGSRLIEKVAWRKVGEQKPLAQQLASRKAERRISKMMDIQVGEALAKLNGRFRNEFRPRLSQRDVYPRWVHFSTTNRELFIEALQGQDDQLGSPTRPPSVPAHDFCIQIHESMPVNSATSFIGGLNMDNKMAENLASELTGSVPTDLQAEEDGGWEIQFDFENPVVLSFRDNRLMIGITGRRFSGAKGSLDERMEISATYEIEKVDDHYLLRRAPEIEVSFPARQDQQLSIRDLAQKELIQKVFAAVFEEELSTDSLKLPDNFKGLNDMKLQYISSQDGWLSLGWK